MSVVINLVAGLWHMFVFALDRVIGRIYLFISVLVVESSHVRLFTVREECK